MTYIYISIVFIFFCVLSIFKKPKTITFRLIGLMLIGWSLSFLGLFLYITGRTEYFYINTNFFDIPFKIWTFFQSISISPFISNRMLNVGVLLFLYSFFCFAIYFTELNKTKYHKLLYYLAIPPIVQVIIYDPWIYKFFYIHIFSTETPYQTFSTFYQLLDHLHVVTSTINVSYIIFSSFIIIRYILKKSSVRFINRISIFVTISIVSIAISHSVMFSWAPKMLINVAVSANYYNFLPIHNFTLSKTTLTLFQVIVFLSFTGIIITMLRYNMINITDNKKGYQISKGINVANLGAKIFSHAVKNQLICIISEAETLEEMLKDNPEAQPHIQNITDVCSTTLNRINNLQNKLNDIKLNFQAGSLDTIVDDVIDRFSHDKTIHFDKNYTSPPPVCFIDREHINELLFNIIKNAEEASKENDIKEINVTISKGDRWGEISISDQGCGISQSDIREIFTPFYSTKSTATNWGVGLSYCHKIIKEHGGKISVISQKNKGTTFTILLPLID